MGTGCESDIILLESWSVCVTLVSATWWHKSMTDIYGDSFFVAVQPFTNEHHQKTLIINGTSSRSPIWTDLGNEAWIFFILDFQSSQKIGDDKILLQNIMSTEYIFLQLFLRVKISTQVYEHLMFCPFDGIRWGLMQVARSGSIYAV